LVEEGRIRQAVRAGLWSNNEEVIPEEAPRLNEFVDEFIEVYAENNNSPAEITNKGQVLRNHLCPFFGRMRLDAIGTRQIERFKALQRKKGLKPKTINNNLTVLRKVLGVAQDWELIAHAPQIHRLKVPQQPFDFLTFEEAEQLAAAATAEPLWSAMILLGMKAGLRLGELRGLTWKAIDLSAGRLMVHQAVSREILGPPKWRVVREVPLPDCAIVALKAHRHLRGPFVFCQDNGAFLTQGRCKAPLKRAYRRAGLRHIGWHALRHTYASHLVMRGAPLKVVQELLGHKHIEMTMRYAHLSPDVRRDAVKLLDVVG